MGFTFHAVLVSPGSLECGAEKDAEDPEALTEPESWLSQLWLQKHLKTWMLINKRSHNLETVRTFELGEGKFCVQQI